MAAEAHSLAGEATGFLSGLIHPLTSIDHALALLAVGLWAARIGGRTLYFIPIAFVTLMLAGGSLRLLPVEIAYVENAMTLSVLVLGLMLVSAFKVSSPVGVIIVGCFALFHGYAHAEDMLLDTDASSYTAGFSLATAFLNTAGIATGLLLKRWPRYNLDRYLGGLVALAGAWLAALA